jgi:hypothetical protein
MIVSLGCVLQLQRFDLGDWTIGSNSIIAVCASIFVLVSPVFYMIMFYGFRHFLSDKAIEETAGALYSDLRHNKILPLLYYPLFFARRILYVFIQVCLVESPNL